MSSITFSRRYSSSTSSRPMINRAVVEYINEEQLIGRTPDLKYFKRINIKFRQDGGLNHKHRCPRCRKTRAFATRGVKSWTLDKLKHKFICGFCNAKEQGKLEEFQSKLKK